MKDFGLEGTERVPLFAQELCLICGDQLSIGHPWFQAGPNPNRLFVMMEVRSETDYARHHIQKVVAFFGAMRLFAKALVALGHRVHYLPLDAAENAQQFDLNLLQLVTQTGASRVSWQLPDEYRLDQHLASLAETLKQQGVVVSAFDTAHFFTLPRPRRAGGIGMAELRMGQLYRCT